MNFLKKKEEWPIKNSINLRKNNDIYQNIKKYIKLFFSLW